MEQPQIKHKEPVSQHSNRLGLDIFLGLLLTLVLHMLQLGLIPFLVWSLSLPTVLKSQLDLFSLLGFTQLLYIIPAIFHFRRRSSRGVMIGLIIGASLTFLIGLPFAYACANKPLYGFAPRNSS